MVTLPKPEVVCRIEDYSDTEDSLNSPDSHVNEKLIHGLSKIRSRLKPKQKASKDHSPTSSTSERGRFRNLEISGPILQTTIDTKLHLIPVRSLAWTDLLKLSQVSILQAVSGLQADHSDFFLIAIAQYIFERR